MKSCIQDALDDLLSPRTTCETKSKSLQVLEQQLALACFSTSQENDTGARASFLALQHTFECNIPARLLPWVTQATARLEHLTNKGTVEHEKVSEVGELTSLLATALSLLQGTCLIHEPTKHYLGRKASLEVLLELLLTSRHLAPDSTEKLTTSTIPTNLSAHVIDTLLCILVDTSMALRAFEDANGVQAVVKILKRAGTPREVRMKCLEFLYFYLLDESPDVNTTPSPAALQQLIHPTPPPTAPATPVRDGKPHLTSQPQHPTFMSRYGSSTYALSGISGAFSITSNSTISDGASPGSLASSASNSTSSSRSLRSLSGSSNTSISSTTSSAEATSLPPPSPVKESHKVFSPPPAISPTSTNNIRNVNKPLPPINSPRPGVTHKSPIKRLPTSHTSSPSMTSPLNTRTPPHSPPVSAGNAPHFPPVKSMMMLKKEVDYTPMSPKKVANVTPVARRPGHRKSLSTSSFTASSSSSNSTSSAEASHRVFSSGLRSRAPTSGLNQAQEPPVPVIPHQYRQNKQLREDSEKENVGIARPSKSSKEGKEPDNSLNHATWKTTEEKKHLLGTMLGNVDALVEGVRKAGIWGLA
ncbi:cell division control protein 14, SIN component-domain-containing protein [Panaeolus papilionaceus]|nr:cell division control protein 14, SIN component-domain-containing protein [Panaeolus papilionaceus]